MYQPTLPWDSVDHESERVQSLKRAKGKNFVRVVHNQAHTIGIVIAYQMIQVLNPRFNPKAARLENPETLIQELGSMLNPGETPTDALSATPHRRRPHQTSRFKEVLKLGSSLIISSHLERE